jgi:protein-S-isoprenylcysteine O-methyltransferase Ste14
MGLDLRWPIGLMFSLIGALLVIDGLVTASNTEMYARSLGININLYWGLLLLVFGGLMLLLAWKGAQTDAREQASRQEGQSDQLGTRR